ncbi:MAG: lasso peptide biosynthesis B2 protein [Sumerlaeia bacterium]
MISRRDRLPLLVLTILPIVWFFPLLTGKLPDFMDTVTQLYPYRLAVARQLHHGTLPLWLPNIFSGMPLAANPQVAAWYPPNLIFYLLPNPIGNGIICILHYWIAGMGAYAYARQQRCVPAASLFAGIAFAFGSFLISRIALTPHLYTAAWMPWMFLAIERAVAAHSGLRPNRATLAVAVLFAMQVLAGSPQIGYYTAMALPIYWIGRAASLRGVRGVAEAFAQGFAAAVLAGLLAGIQLVPSLEFLAATERGAIDIGKLQGQGLNGPFLWKALVGGTGNPIEDTDSIYAIGLGLFALIPLGLLRRRHRPVALPLLAIGGLGYLLAMGPLVPLWAKVLPLYGSFHAPRRALVLWAVAGPLVAAMGAQRLLLLARRHRLPRFAAPAALALLLIPTAWMLPRLEREFTDTSRFKPPAKLLATLGTDRYLTIDPSLNYSYASRAPEYGHSLMPDLAAWHDTHDVQGYDPLVLERYGIARRLASARSGVFYPSHGAFFTDPGSPILRLMHAQYLIGRWDLFDPGRVIPGASIDREALAGQLNLLIDHPKWPLWRYRDDRPLAWAVQRAVEVSTPEQAIPTAAAQPDPYRVAFVEQPLALAPQASPPEVAAAWDDARTVAVRLQEPARQETLVCIAVSWMKGWTATGGDSGEPLSVLPANGFLAGVLVPPGESGFVLRYAPASFWRGAMLSLAGLILLVALWAKGNTSEQGSACYTERTARNVGLFLEAFSLLWLARMGLWVLPFRVIRRRWLTSVPSTPEPATEDTVRHIRRVRKALALAGRAVPRADCLPRALVAHRLLARRGIATELHLGARHGTAGFEAHAWLEWRGQVVVGGDFAPGDPAAFQPFEPLPEDPGK